MPREGARVYTRCSLPDNPGEVRCRCNEHSESHRDHGDPKNNNGCTNNVVGNLFDHARLNETTGRRLQCNSVGNLKEQGKSTPIRSLRLRNGFHSKGIQQTTPKRGMALDIYALINGSVISVEKTDELYDLPGCAEGRSIGLAVAGKHAEFAVIGRLHSEVKADKDIRAARVRFWPKADIGLNHSPASDEKSGSSSLKAFASILAVNLIQV